MIQQVSVDQQTIERALIGCNYGTVSQVINLVVRGRALLAGGMFRRVMDPADTLADIDLFFQSDEQKRQCVNHFDDRDFQFKNIFRCPEGKLFSYKDCDGTKIQLIAEDFYPDIPNCISTFDLSPCMAGWDGKMLFYDGKMPTDVHRKRLRINRVDYPAATLKRVEKYVKKGYTLPSEEAVKLVDLIRLPTTVDTRIYID